MRYYEASPMIASSPEAVWAMLTDATAPGRPFPDPFARGLKRRADTGR